MDNMENMENELQHHGVKGMKWGVRRTPAQLGHRVPRRKKLASRWEENKKKREAKAAEKAEKRTKKLRGEKVANKRTMHDMSDEELAAAINRARMEDTYRALRPRKVGIGKRFVRSLGNDVIAPAAKNAGKQFLEDALKKVGKNILGEDPKNSYDELKKYYDELKLKKDINDILNPKPDKVDWNNELKRLEYESKTKGNTGTDDDGNASATSNSSGSDKKPKSFPETVNVPNSTNTGTTKKWRPGEVYVETERKHSEDSGPSGTKTAGLLPPGAKSKNDSNSSSKSSNSKNETISIYDPGVTLLDPVSSSSKSNKSSNTSPRTYVVDFEDTSASSAVSSNRNAVSSGKASVAGYLSAPASSSTSSNSSATAKGKSFWDSLSTGTDEWKDWV